MPLPAKEFTIDELVNIFTNKRPGFFYTKSVEKHEEFLPHSDGKKPLRIIDKQRPNEPDIVKAFRLDIWEPITKPTFSRVLSSLNKIRRSSDWSISYPKEQFPKIKNGEELNEYCENKYPYFTSVTNWIFSVLFKQYLIDPNAVILVIPLNADIVDQSGYLEPFTYIYNSCDVLDFHTGEYAILRRNEGCTYFDDKGDMRIGKSFYVITTTNIDRYDQIDEKENYDVTQYAHNLDWLPAFKTGGIICESEENNFLYESRISGILPNLNEAVAEYTDLQAGKRLHIYPERWEFSQHECSKCKGTGILVNSNWRAGMPASARQTTCDNCVNGYIPSGPFSKMIVRPIKAGDAAIPTPPAGYIQKEIDIIRLMQESIDRHIYRALSSINFQFLEETPLNQSGTAKEVDKEELNNTVHSIAEDLVYLMDKIYKTIAYYRYSNLYSKEEIDNMLPVIAVPEHFDLISSQYMQEEIKRAHDANLNGILISEMEVEFSAKRFSQDADINKIIRLVHILDPFPGATIDEKIGMLSNKTITREDNIISDNIIQFVRQALFENPNFDNLSLDKQQEQMIMYAQERIESMDETARLIADALSNNDTSDSMDEPIDEPIAE